VSISQKQIVSLKSVCEMAGVALSSVYFARKALDSAETSRPRRAAVGGYTDMQLVEQVRLVLAATAFLGDGYRKIWEKLRHRGVRASRARVLRLMREHRLRAPSHSGRVRGPRSHDGTIIPAAPDLRWGTDLTGTWTAENGGVSVMLTVDHHTAEILGIHAAKRATRWEALEPARQAVRRCFGQIRAQVAHGLQLRHDHGSQCISTDFQKEIGFLGIQSSPAFVRVPEGHGCVERAIRTLKEQLLWVKTIETIEICESRCCNGPSCTTNSDSSTVTASSLPLNAGESSTLKMKSWPHERSD
jgi:putative transposase